MVGAAGEISGNRFQPNGQIRKVGEEAPPE